MHTLAVSRTPRLSAILRDDATLAVGFAVLTALAAQIRVYMPGNPVPVTLQTVPVALAAMVLPARFGLLSMVLYLAAGAGGLPVFADVSAGLQMLVGPTGGYLLGFLFAPAIVAPVAKAWALRSSFFGAFLGALLLHAIVFACGIPWLKLTMGWSWSDAFTKGCLVFWLGTLLKSGLAATLAPARR